MTTISITLHDTNTEEIIGTVIPVTPINFPQFYEIIEKSFIAFHKSDLYSDGDYDIFDFVEFHNETNEEIEIDFLVNDFIQLSKKNL